MYRRIARIAVAAGVCAAVLAPASLASSREPRIGPNQTFVGLINGRGGGTTPVVVRTNCVGPIRPGQMGHPLSGQTIGVSLAPTATDNVGHTGKSATSIVAFFGAPPPGAPPSTNTVGFTRYATKPLPRTLAVPCSGAGHVFFVPLPMNPPSSQAATVNVTYVGQP
jgi:hypothetical protein